jgi:hypothetical protein
LLILESTILIKDIFDYKESPAFSSSKYLSSTNLLA